MHLITAENDYRLLETTQDYYMAMEKYDSSISVENIIQSAILAHHCDHEKKESQQSPWKCTKEGLAIYRRTISQYTHLPNIRQKAFFLRNNIMVEGVPIGSIIPRDMSFVQLVDSSIASAAITTMKTNLGYWMDHAISLNKTLIIFSGSLTWYNIPSQPTPSLNPLLLLTHSFTQPTPSLNPHLLHLSPQTSISCICTHVR